MLSLCTVQEVSLSHSGELGKGEREVDKLGPVPSVNSRIRTHSLVDSPMDQSSPAVPSRAAVSEETLCL